MLVFVTFMFNCSKSDSDPTGMKGWTDAIIKYNAKMKDMKNADDCAAAINEFADDMKKLDPKLTAFLKKYPKGLKQNPEEVDEETAEKFKKAFGENIQHGFKMAKYMKDPKVQKAQKKLMEAMTFMNLMKKK